jgi:tetratricopeptide (TPR) repeat protein
MMTQHIRKTRIGMRPALRRSVSAWALVAALSFFAPWPAVAQLPSVYSRCANAEANPSAAIPACSAIIQSGRDSGRNLVVSYYNRGIGWLKQGQLDRAAADLSQAIRIDPGYAHADNVRGLVYVKQNKPDQAIESFNQAIRLNPRFVQAYNNRGLAYRSKREPDRALVDLNQAISIDPTYPLAYFSRSLVWRDKGDVDRAIADVNQGLRFDPRNASAYANRGLLHERKGNLPQALADFRSALNIEPNQSVALAGQARVTAASAPAAPPTATEGRRTAEIVPPVSRVPAPTVTDIVPPTPAPPPPTSRPIPTSSLSEALAACEKLVDGKSQQGIEIPNGDGKLVFPTSYYGRRHLDCVVNAMVDEATAIDRDYGEIVRSSYPDLRDANAICRIESARLADHIARSQTFDARASLLQKTFTANAATIEEVRQTLGNVDLSSITDSAALMKSILNHVSGPIEQAASRQRDVLRLMQGIEASQKAMTAVQNVRKLICP